MKNYDDTLSDILSKSTKSVKQANQSNSKKPFKPVKHNQPKPKKVNKSKTVSEAPKKNSIKKSKNPFIQKNTKKKKIQYENIRVRKSVFEDLRRAQFADGISSRSKLLAIMYNYCKPALYATSGAKTRAKKFNKMEKIKNKK